MAKSSFISGTEGWKRSADSKDVRDLRLPSIVYARSRFVPEQQSKFLLEER